MMPSMHRMTEGILALSRNQPCAIEGREDGLKKSPAEESQVKICISISAVIRSAGCCAWILASASCEIKTAWCSCEPGQQHSCSMVEFEMFQKLYLINLFSKQIHMCPNHTLACGCVLRMTLWRHMQCFSLIKVGSVNRIIDVSPSECEPLVTETIFEKFGWGKHH